jgi:hypothetical protein
MIMGDLNAQISSQPIPEVVGHLGKVSDQEIRSFIAYNDFKITHIFP